MSSTQILHAAIKTDGTAWVWGIMKKENWDLNC